MTLAEKQTSTIHYMYGEWEFKSANTQIHILISKAHHSVQLNFNGQKSEFTSGGHWMGDNHLYFDHVHFVRHADENKMIFGKNMSGVVGVDNEWEETFTRIK
jgi:hypothetical protein